MRLLPSLRFLFLPCSQIFMFGDLNYRINPLTMDPDRAKLLIENEKFPQILEHDQLKDQMKLGNVFQGFTEGSLNFRPTYKYDTGTDNWDSSEKNRSPAWCDRILYKGQEISQVDYLSQSQYKLSDHKPISSAFDVKVLEKDIFCNSRKEGKVTFFSSHSR